MTLSNLGFNDKFRTVRCFLASFLVLFPIIAAFGQVPKRYFASNDKNDTLTILLSSQELAESRFRRVAFLKHKEKKKKKKLLEGTYSIIKLYQEDSTFFAFITDFYEDYFIAFTGKERQVSKMRISLSPVAFRRTRFDEIEWIETSGKRRIIPKVLLSTFLITAGLSLALSTNNSQAKIPNIPPAFLPVSLGIAYVGVRLFDDILTKRYNMERWYFAVQTLNTNRLQKDK